jgi:secreted PhoX family phosphatase
LTGFNALDGSVYDPLTRTLLFTQENGANGGAVELTTGWPPVLTRLDGILGKGGYEGIHPDDKGNLYIAEDVGGVSTNVLRGDPASPKAARQPNSFVYRFVPYDPQRLAGGGKLQAARVTVDGSPITFHANAIDDVFATVQLDLHQKGTAWPFTWVTVHDTGFLPPGASQPAAFDANAAAKAAGATPFKRPENLAFLPDHFDTLFFDETGDTDARAGQVPGLAARGSWGSIFSLDFDRSGDGGTISIFALGDAEHASFDNLYFADRDTLLTAEDRGDTLHDQLNRLDSIWAYDVRSGAAVRFVALGRDALAAPVGAEDNEPTGMMVSNGAADIEHMVGTRDALDDARAFFTVQHGDNALFEILARKDERKGANSR